MNLYKDFFLEIINSRKFLTPLEMIIETLEKTDSEKYSKLISEVKADDERLRNMPVINPMQFDNLYYQACLTAEKYAKQVQEIPEFIEQFLKNYQAENKRK